MHKRLFFYSLWLFMTTTLATAQTVDEVIDRHLEALGGVANLRNIRSIKMEGTLQLRGKTVPLTIYALNRKGLRMDVLSPGMTQTTAISDSVSWMIDPFVGKTDPEPMPDVTKQMLIEQLDLSGPLVDYREKGNKVALLGKVKLEGVEVYKLKLTRKSGLIELSYIDASTYLPVKSESVQKQNGEEQTGESWSSDYRKVNGYTFAFVNKTRSPGETGSQLIRFDRIEVNPPISESLFKMPTAKP